MTFIKKISKNTLTGLNNWHRK